VALLLATVAALVLLPGWPRQAAFVGPAPGLSFRPLQASPRLRLRAEKDDKKVVDADIVNEDSDSEDSEEELSSDEEYSDDEATEGYPEESYRNYDPKEDPPDSWFERRYVDRHKVNMLFFDMYAKPKSFFPHELKPGDTVRAFYMQAGLSDKPDGMVTPYDPWPMTNMKEIYVDGVILRFRGQYQGRTMTVRTMMGKGVEKMGVEVTIPIHSPLLTKIEVLRRGYIGRNKNAYFVRAMIGKRNVIPVDKERTEMDRLYQNLRDDKREDEIPEVEYPTADWESYPLPTWWQDTEQWDEANYDPEMFDDRNRYEKEVIGGHRSRVRVGLAKNSDSGKGK